ncbi:MAG: putative bacteriophage protein [Frankiales bacterium]|nr:putative bacteriophage protein [Frankiales bacterium]
MDDMCGRYVLDRRSDLIAAEFEATDTAESVVPAHYNIPPTSTVPVVIAAGGQRRLGEMRWGISGTRDGRTTLLFNSRVETLLDRPASRGPRRRCLVPATGYYEWAQDGTARRPHLVRDPQRSTIAMAGLYDGSRAEAGPITWAFSIVTTAATGELARIHARRPLVVPPELWDVWLDEQDPVTDVLRALVAQQRLLAAVAVGPSVGDVRNKDPSLMAALP